jgi:hypothetical protein
MAFLIPDNLRSRQDVPAGIRRVASALQVGLDESAVVWYEPLYDPTGAKPHLVVFIPDLGIIVLEVLELKAGGLLGVLRGRLRVERDGAEVELDNPLVRAERLATTLRERIAAESRLTSVAVPVGAGAVFGALTVEDADRRGLARLVPPERCLFRPDLDSAIDGSGEATLLRRFGRMAGAVQAQAIPPDLIPVIRGIVQPEIVIDAVAGATAGLSLTIFRPPENDDHDIVRVMDRHQEAMAKSLGEGHRVVRGVAGSGKTLILVYRARLLSRMQPGEAFLVTCYTRSLASQLRAVLADCDNVTVAHLDKLMWRVIREARLPHPRYDDDGEQVARTALTGVQRGAGPRYRAVLLDEAQDFGTTALQFATGPLKPGCDDLVIVADAAQNIFRRRFSWRQAGIQAQGRTRILRVNYRNTREILEFASRFLLASRVLRPEEVPDPEDEQAIIPPESAARSGVLPEVRIAPSLDTELDAAVETIRGTLRHRSTPRTAALLYASQHDGQRERAACLYNRLREAGLSVFWATDPSDRAARDRIAAASEPVILSTIHSAKGLEFPTVVLCGLWREDQDLESNRKLAYVGMTRATDRLIVIARDNSPLLEDLTAAAQSS